MSRSLKEEKIASRGEDRFKGRRLLQREKIASRRENSFKERK